MYEILRIYGENGNIYVDFDLPEHSDTEPTMMRLTLDEYNEVYALLEKLSKKEFPGKKRIV